MAQFKSWDSYGVFSREVTRQRRYVRTPDAEEFLRTVASTLQDEASPSAQGDDFLASAAWSRLANGGGAIVSL